MLIILQLFHFLIFYWIPLKFWFCFLSAKIKLLCTFELYCCGGLGFCGRGCGCCYCSCCHFSCCCCCCGRDVVLEDRGPGKPGLLVWLLTAQPRVLRPGPTSDVSGGQWRLTRTREAVARADRAGTEMMEMSLFLWNGMKQKHTEINSTDYSVYCWTAVTGWSRSWVES